MNQKSEQYLQFFVDYRQNDWPKQLVTAEFAVNNKTYLVTKVFLFMVNYGRELRMGADIKKRRKVEKTTKFAERIKKVQEETGAALRKTQKEINQQADKERKEIEEQKKDNNIMLSTKDLLFKERLVRKLVD